MSSLAKVNMLGEFGLLPFRRLIQRKPDNYQQAVQEYAARLRKLYHSRLIERQNLLRARKQAIESETFRLNSSGGELNGISIERSCLPCAELGDEIVLIKQDDANSGAALAQGVIVKVTSKQIRIKFQEPIFKAIKEDHAEESVADVVKTDEAAAGPSAINRSDKEAAKASAEEESQEEAEKKEEFVDFRIRFNLMHDNKIDLLHDENFRTIETTLANFERLKCNQAIQRSLLGFYDERHDTLNDRARVMAFTELVLKLNGQQRAAIEQALMRRLTLIEGPAGTGKTVVAAHIAACVGRQRRGRVLVCSPIRETVDRLTELINKVGGIQVVKLPETPQFDSSRDKAKGRRRDSYLSSETKQSNQCHLDKLVDDEIYLQAYSRFKDTLGSSHEKVHAHAFRMISTCSESRRRELETKVISKANVVCCQLNQASSSLLRGTEFDMLIMDDLQVTSELDCLVAIMTKGIKQVTLLSDTRQEIRLARIPKRSQSMRQSSNGTNARRQVPNAVQTSDSLRSKRQNKSRRRARQVSTVSDTISTHSRGTEISRPFSTPNPSLDPGNLFERLVSIGLPTVDMRIQYRCHATVSNFFIHHFYVGRLKDDPETNDQMSTEIVTRLMVLDESFSWLPDKKYLTAIYKVPVSPTIQLASESDRELEQSNAIETKLRELIGKLFSKEGVRKSDYGVGIIYNNQRLANRCKFNQAHIKAGTIEKFIGQGEDFIVLVASEVVGSVTPDTTEIGISSAIPCDFRRSDTVLNWALTRARLGLFIIVDESKCPDDCKENNVDDVVHFSQSEDCKSWRELTKYYAANNLIVG